MGEVEAWIRERNKAGGESGVMLVQLRQGLRSWSQGTGQSYLVWLLLVMWVMCFIAECFCVQFHSASDSQSSGVGLLVFSKSRCWEGYVEG